MAFEALQSLGAKVSTKEIDAPSASMSIGVPEASRIIKLIVLILPGGTQTYL